MYAVIQFYVECTLVSVRNTYTQQGGKEVLGTAWVCKIEFCSRNFTNTSIRL